MKAERIVSWDSLSGLMIVYMMFIHIMQRSGLAELPVNAVLLRILFFFMPWFFYKGGHFWKERSFSQELQVVTRRFLVPYLVFSLAGWGVDILYLCLTGQADIHSLFLTPVHTLIVSGAVPGNLPLWFLPVFAVSRLLFCVLERNRIPPMVVALVSFAFAWVCNRLLPIPFYIGTTFAGLSFFAFGAACRNFDDRKTVILVAFAIYLGIMIFFPSVVDVRSNRTLSGWYPVFFVASLSGIITLKGLTSWLLDGRIRKGPFRFIGLRSLNYYVLHWILLTICLILSCLFGPMVSWVMALVMGIVCLTVPAFVHFTPILFPAGNKQR